MDSLDIALESAARMLRSGGAFSLVFKNRDALAFRHAAEGRIEEAIRVLDDPLDAGNLGIFNRARNLEEVIPALSSAGFEVQKILGVRVFTDLVRSPDSSDLKELVRLELEASGREPYRSVSRLLHVVCTRS